MRKARALFVNLLILCVTFLFSFFFVYELFKCIQVFVIIRNPWILRLPLIISAVVSLFFCIIIAQKTQSIKETKLGFWIDNNWPKVFFGYTILLLFLASVTSNKTWTADDINDILTIEWTIFGLSLTIFLVWNVIIVDYLKKKKPQEAEKPDYFQQYELLKEKQSFSQEVESTFSKTILLSINLFILLISSTLVYIEQSSESLFTQILVRCAFFFSTNTIISFFLDMLKPLKADKDNLKKTSQVSMKELDTAMTGAIIHTLFNEGVKQINASSEYSDEEKKQLSTLYVNTMRDVLLEIAKKDSKGDDSNHTEEAEK